MAAARLHTCRPPGHVGSARPCRHCQALPGTAGLRTCRPPGHVGVQDARAAVQGGVQDHARHLGLPRGQPCLQAGKARTRACRRQRASAVSERARKRQCGAVGPQATVRESGPASDARGVGGGGGSGVVSSRLVATGEGHARAGWQVATTEGYTASQRRHPPPPAPAPTLRALPMAALVRARTHSGPRPHALPVQDDVRGLEAALLGQMVKHGGNVGLGHARGEGGREVAWFG